VSVGVVLLVLLVFVAGIALGVIAIVAISVRQEDQPTQREGHASRVGLSTGTLLDPSGLSVYALTRRLLAVRRPDRSPMGPFRASARTVGDAYGEAVQDEREDMSWER